MPFKAWEERIMTRNKKRKGHVLINREGYAMNLRILSNTVKKKME